MNAPGSSRRTLAEINVTPLVDVMLVLLIIFMVAAPMMQRGIDVNQPVARRAQPITSERIYVTVPISFGRDRTVRLGDDRVRVEVLDERVRQALVAPSINRALSVIKKEVGRAVGRLPPHRIILLY